MTQDSQSKLSVETIVSMPFAENTYIAYLEGRNDCFVLDPGLESQKIIDWLEQNNRTPAAFLCTHGHYDHIAGNAAMKDRWPDAPIVIGHGDAYKLTDPDANLSGGYGLPMESPPADVLLHEDEIYETAGIELLVKETPGHSAGHVVFIAKSEKPMHVFNGDVLFREGVGRTDFFDGDSAQLIDSIQNKLFTLPDETIIYTGHGPSTTIGHEKVNNPFVGKRASGAW